MGTPAASHTTFARTLRYEGGWDRARAVEVPVEAPVNLVYGTIPHVVLMVTPADLEDLILGFSLTEGMITDREEIRGISLRQTERGLVADIDLVPAAMTRFLARRRNMTGRTSCGLCGVESLDLLPQAAKAEPGKPIDPPVIARALSVLKTLQPLYRATHAVHAAAWFDRAGTPLIVREDVGRHNALDKMIGACLRQSCPPDAGFAVITSRCSFEMLEKAAMFGASTLVAISAPTSLAIERARALGVTLIAVARADAAMSFTDPPPTLAKAIP